MTDTDDKITPRQQTTFENIVTKDEIAFERISLFLSENDINWSKCKTLFCRWFQLQQMRQKLTI